MRENNPKLMLLPRAFSTWLKENSVKFFFDGDFKFHRLSFEVRSFNSLFVLFFGLNILIANS